MDILEKIHFYASACPGRTAVRTGREELTYSQLWEYSGKLAQWLEKEFPKMDASVPLPVYGHKSPWMLVCFLACVRSGHSYCPIDISVPSARIRGILQALPEGPVLTTCPFPVMDTGRPVADPEVIREVCRDPADNKSGECRAVRGDDVFYIIFTSGSTGTPKGVMITADCLNHYLDWSVCLAGISPEISEDEGAVFLNQAPFSFDLSVMDLYTCLACGGTLVCLTKEVQGDYRSLMKTLQESAARVWVSTPSFADVCLADPSFGSELMPRLEVFLFCGETLANKTAGKLLDRFPQARMINTYGPTESTVCVTGTEITKALASGPDPLPVGRAKPGTVIEIRSEDGGLLPEGEKGEIVILGDTVSPGYYGQKELTQKAFFTSGDVRGYRTGDAGYLSGGMLFFCGRIDLQIKLHGYRIELEDIEANLCRLPQTEKAVVIPNERGGKVTSLTAYIVPSGGIPADKTARKEFQDRIRKELLTFLPEYMIPKKIVLTGQIPMTANGKADRKRLAAEAANGQTGDRKP